MKKRTDRELGIIWCGNARRGRANGWAFPPAVERHLREMTQGKTVLHLFGGHSRWGTRIDIDPTVRPHVIADAWLPPFGQDSFDVVILDPPYLGINQQMKQYLLRAARFVARETVWWFHTMWVAGDTRLRAGRSWFVRVGDTCDVRCLQEFHVGTAPKILPPTHFTRGPAIRYNRWTNGNVGLPLEHAEPPHVVMARTLAKRGVRRRA